MDARSREVYTRASIPSGRIVAAPRGSPPTHYPREGGLAIRKDFTSAGCPTIRRRTQPCEAGVLRPLAAWKRYTGSMAVVCLDNHTAATGDRGSDGHQVRRVGVRRSGAPGGRDRGLTARTRHPIEVGTMLSRLRAPQADSLVEMAPAE